MNLKFSKKIGQGNLTLTDFNCSSFEERLGVGDFFKIIWAKDNAITMGSTLFVQQDASFSENVYIATENKLIANIVKKAGYNVIITSDSC